MWRPSPVTLETLHTDSEDRDSLDAWNSDGTVLDGSWYGLVRSTDCQFEASALFG